MAPWLTATDEGLLWDFIDRAPVALVAADNERNILRVNEHWLRMLGYGSARARELKIDDLLAPESRPGIDMRWADLISTGLAMARIVFLREDGSRLHARYGAFANVLPGVHVAVYLPEPGRDRSSRPARSRRAGQLTRREQESLRLVAMGLTTTAAAERLGISPETVRTHVRNAMNKLGARTRAQAIAVAMRDGEIPA
jgi:PAS domain S-box-containing protein